MKRYALSLVLLLIFAGAVQAQQQTGEIFGKATDQSGAVLPGVTVTLTAPHLLEPLTAVTSETGTYQFPRLEIGTYTVKFELTGFKTQINPDVIVTVGFSAQINAQLGVSTVQETITVTGQSPIVDTKDTGTKQTFTNELLQSIPSARDPWVILQQTAGIAMDRENIGGNMSGQQSNYVSRGGSPFNNKWSLDGVDITDMAATGGSPTYFDFDMFEEMTVNTGGVDVMQQTGGVGINLVTKAGSDKFRGSSRSGMESLRTAFCCTDPGVLARRFWPKPQPASSASTFTTSNRPRSSPGKSALARRTSGRLFKGHTSFGLSCSSSMSWIPSGLSGSNWVVRTTLEAAPGPITLSLRN